MTEREAIELRAGLQGPFGRWVLTLLKERGLDIVTQAVEFVPTSLGEMNDREQNFGRGKALIELANQIPNIIDELIKQNKET